jgi:hypothetical protein
MKREQLERALALYHRLLSFESKNKELSSINTNTKETMLIFDMPKDVVKIPIGKTSLKHIVEYLLACGEQEIEKCKEKLEEL